MKSIKEIVGQGLGLTPSPGQRSSGISGLGAPAEIAEAACPYCHGRGIVFDGEDQVARPCVCMREQKLANQFRFARMAKSLRDCRLENFSLRYYTDGSAEKATHLENAQKALKAAEEFLERCRSKPQGLGLLFTGPVGSGKTFLAAAITNGLIEQGIQVLFLVVPDLLDELRATYDKRSETMEIDLLDTARSVPVLVLDDLGAHNYTEWTRNRLYSIINYRLNEELPTIVTTNLTLQELEEHLGQRTSSRLVQMTRVFRLTCELDIRLCRYQEREGRK